MQKRQMLQTLADQASVVEASKALFVNFVAI
ncbi:hypothetical protein BSG1_16780 [Bacillus sp. SG-1]|nr:hypothetical protein BSG1_16780 [Bacillus sp. SG-1]